MKKSSIIGSFFILLILSLSGLGFIYRQDLFDWYKLKDYTPSQEVVGLANSTTMNDAARRLFYVNRPIIADNSTFNEHCRDNRHSIVLGCYLSGQRGIYLLDVEDERLQGIKEVTAAHEFLHAAYERLDNNEKIKIDKLIEDTYNKLDNTRIRETVDLYKKEDPKIVPNELHSMLGSEVRNLPPALEEYYKKYFSNRLVIVNYSEKYEQAFLDRQDAVRQYDIELKNLKVKIDSESDRLSKEGDDIKSFRSELDNLKNSNVELYNTKVKEFNSRVSEYNNSIDQLEAMVVKYNETVQKRNNVVTEQGELIDAIDSREVVPTQR